jgi:hypothetical protein
MVSELTNHFATNLNLLLISLKSGHRIVVAHAELKIIHYFSLTSG